MNVGLDVMLIKRMENMADAEVAVTGQEQDGAMMCTLLEVGDVRLIILKQKVTMAVLHGISSA